MEFCGFPGTYSVKGDEVICRMMGEETLLSFEGEYLVEKKEHQITGYVISSGFWPDGNTSEKHLDGISRIFRVETYYNKAD